MLSLQELTEIKGQKIPHHIAIIPDGNRRWAKHRALDTADGHQQGADSLMDIVTAAKKIGVKAITFYSFSTENWSRSSEEVEALMWLIEGYLEDQLPLMVKEGICFHAIGNLDPLPETLKERVKATELKTASLLDIHLTLALNYGSKDELARACRKLASQVASQKITVDEITESMIAKSLDTAFLPDPDLLIRTSGECRLSNFLLWQLSYAEMYISPVLWPDFTPRHLLEAVKAYQKRERRKGGDSE